MRYEAYTMNTTQHRHSPGRPLLTPATLTSSPHFAHTSVQDARPHSPHLRQQRSPFRHRRQTLRPSRTPLSRIPRQRRTSPTNSPTSKISNNTSQSNTPSYAPNSTSSKPTPPSPPRPLSNVRQSSRHGRPNISAPRSGRLSRNSPLFNLATRVP